eukprot:scaffold393_cov363-Pavlova_lutheri.AAC.2
MKTVEECLQYLRDEAKNIVDIYYARSKNDAECNETKERSIHWFAKSVQCPVDDDFRIDLKIRY